jgi:hypothetical protein
MARSRQTVVSASIVTDEGAWAINMDENAMEAPQEQDRETRRQGEREMGQGNAER